MPTMTTNAGNRIAFDIQGNRTPILFVAPPVIGMDVFHYQVKALRDSFQLIRFDLPGHGRSSPLSSRLTYDHVVEDMRELLLSLDQPRAIVCGYSMGGTIVLEFMRKHPEQSLGGIVLSGFSEATDPVLKAELAAGAFAARSRATKALALALAFGNADCKASFRRMWEAGKTAQSKEVADVFQQAVYCNITNQLSAIQSPVCLVYGGDDKRFHRYGHILQRHLRHSEFHVIPKVGHQLPTKAPGPLNEIMRAFSSMCEMA